MDDGTYERSEFRHWIDLDRDGCDTKCLVKKAQAVRPEGSTRSGWWSSYDAQFITSQRKIQVDHVVSLKEAWTSGARNWDDGKREVFANDLDGELLVVSSSTNESKGARDVSGWRPDVRAAWCDLAARVVKVKAKWRLAVDPAEKASLAEMLSTCQ